MSSAGHRFFIGAVFLVMGAVSFFGPITAAHAQESVSVEPQQRRRRPRRRGFGASYASVRLLTWTRSLASGIEANPLILRRRQVAAL